MLIDQHISGVEAIIGYTFLEKSVCAEALQMQASPGANLTFGGQKSIIPHNERLELLGDRITQAVLCKTWYNMCDTKGQSSSLGDYTVIRNALVSNKALGERGFQLGLDRFVIAHPGTTTVSQGMMANTFEAILGAVSLDAGNNMLEAVHQVLEHTGFFDHPMLVT